MIEQICHTLLEIVRTANNLHCHLIVREDSVEITRGSQKFTPFHYVHPTFPVRLKLHERAQLFQWLAHCGLDMSNKELASQIWQYFSFFTPCDITFISKRCVKVEALQ
jgi:hypothetical protein